MDRANVCPACGFGNPKAWRTCASCKRPLDPDRAAPWPVTQARTTSSERTEVAQLDSIAGRDFALLESAVELSSDELLDEGPIVVEPPVSGNDSVLTGLDTLVRSAFASSKAALAFVMGPRGSGRTRMLQYASEVAARSDRRVLVLYGSCREGGDATYAPFSRLLLERCGITPSSGPGAARTQLLELVRSVLPDESESSQTEIAHLLGHIAGVPFPTSPFLSGLRDQPAELSVRARAAFCRLLQRELDERPVLLLLDGFHGAEPAAWDLLHACLTIHGALACVVASCQMDVPASFDIPHVTFPIEPLTASAVISMLSAMFPGTTFPDSLTELLLDRTQGNPAALRELLCSLVDGGVFAAADDGSTKIDLSLLGAAGFSQSEADMQEARIARLQPSERVTLEQASVVGEHFWDGTILGQLRTEQPRPETDDLPLSIWSDDHDIEALNQSLDRLVSKGFLEIVPESDLPGAVEYQFAVPGLRDMLYESLSPQVRFARHRAVARWLALAGSVRRDRVAAMIAPHLEKAGQSTRAGRAYLEAAHHERLGLRPARALVYLEKALDHIPSEDLVRRIEALHEYGSVLSTAGRYDDAERAFTEMLRLAWSVGAKSKGAAALNRIARVKRSRGEEDAAFAFAGRSLELFRSAGDVRGIAATLDDLAQIALLRGETHVAAAHAREALELRRTQGDSRGEALSLNTLGMVEFRRGNLDAAQQLFSLALELRKQHGDREGAVNTHIALGAVVCERGDRSAAVAAWESALDLAKEIGDRRGECFLLNHIGEALTSLADFARADLTLHRALSIAMTLGDRRALAEILRNLAQLAVDRNDEDAGRRVQEALHIADSYGAKEAVAKAMRVDASLRTRTLFATDGEITESASDIYKKVIELFDTIGNEREKTRTEIALALHQLELGQPPDAASLTRLRTCCGKLGLAREVEMLDGLS